MTQLGRGAAVLVALLSVHLLRAGAALACDQVCIADDHYEAMLNASKYALVGRVTEKADTTEGPVFTVKALRVWKGAKKTITVRNVSGMCGQTLQVGRVYVILAHSDPQDIYSACGPPFAVWRQDGKTAVTRLDRLRRFPPLSLPAADLVGK